MVKHRTTEQEYREAFAASKSLAGVCRHLGIVSIGGNYATLKRKVVQLQIDTSHFTGQGWNKGNFSAKPNSKLTIKRYLLRERGHRCESCGLSEWLGLPIMIELEHVDGNNTNNDFANLLLLCPNCHAQTPTWRGRNLQYDQCACGNRKLIQVAICSDCSKVTRNVKAREGYLCVCGGKKKSSAAKMCIACYRKSTERIEWPPSAELRAQVAARSYLAVAKALGVSDNALRKRLVRHP